MKTFNEFLNSNMHLWMWFTKLELNLFGLKRPEPGIGLGPGGQPKGNVLQAIKKQLNKLDSLLRTYDKGLPTENFKIAAEAMAEEFENAADKISSNDSEIIHFYKGWTNEELEDYEMKLRELSRSIMEMTKSIL